MARCNYFYACKEGEMPQKAKLEKLLKVATEQFNGMVERGRITNAKQADEAVLTIVNSLGLEIHSPEYHQIRKVMGQQAYDAFPGDWDDEEE
jgi:hypothetical protein